MSRELPSFDLVVATVGRSEELERLLGSLEAQQYARLRVVVVDQNEDERLAPILAERALEVRHIRAARGLARARNAGLALAEGDVVAFPDDDCTYPAGLLAEVARRLAADESLGGISGRVEDESRASSASWKRDAADLDRENVWNRVNSAALFLRRSVVERVGTFDERLGLGSGEPWSSSEEIDYVVRAIGAGARIAYDPSVVVRHRVVPDDAAVGYRDGAGVGYILRKHGYSPRTVARMMVRPIGGALVSLARLDAARSRYYAASLRGRVRGYRATSSSNSTA
ncbi:MAG TPA: glycosyltransferase [Gaiellaceae bacterium]|nr:glycosyltransferase [Gaiellaceae bacterium]